MSTSAIRYFRLLCPDCLSTTDIELFYIKRDNAAACGKCGKTHYMHEYKPHEIDKVMNAAVLGKQDLPETVKAFVGRKYSEDIKRLGVLV